MSRPISYIHKMFSSFSLFSSFFLGFLLFFIFSFFHSFSLFFVDYDNLIFSQDRTLQSTQRASWRIVDPPHCLGGSTHRWVPVDTLSTLVPERDGCGRLTTTQSSAVQCRNCKHGSGALAARALVKRVCCVMADPETSVLLGCLFEQ